jgi:hypothetical protein
LARLLKEGLTAGRGRECETLRNRANARSAGVEARLQRFAVRCACNDVERHAGTPRVNSSWRKSKDGAMSQRVLCGVAKTFALHDLRERGPGIAERFPY